MTCLANRTLCSRSATSGKSSLLRDMLKTPRFATTNLAQQPPAGPMSSRSVSFATTDRRASDKENFYNNLLPTSKASHIGSLTGSHMANRAPSSNDAFHSTQDARIGKAQSSVASSSHYAQGYLPQHPSNGQPSSDYYVRYHTPQSYNHAQGAYHGHPGYGLSSPSRYPPQYDGPAESSPPSKAHSEYMVNSVGEMANGINEADSKISVQDFQVDRGDAPPGHGFAVDGFFRNVREAERKEMNSSEQKASNGL